MASAQQQSQSFDTRRILAAQEWCQEALLQRLSRFGADNQALINDLRTLRIGEPAIAKFETVLKMQERIPGVDLDRILELHEAPQLQVFSGHQSINGRAVLVLTSSWIDPAQLRRFHRECALLKDVTHNCIATLLACGETRGVCWATFDAPTGHPLQHRLMDAPLPEAEALWLMRQFVSGLSTQRLMGIGSRYATPHALWIVRDGAPLPSAYLVDIGIMRNLIGPKRQSSLDPVDYLSPEQVRGQQPDELSLVYHCGAILYHALVGSPPFVESDPELVRKAHLFEEVPALHRLFPDLDPVTCELVATALSKEPEDRCGSLAEFQLSLERVLERKGLLLSAPDVEDEPYAHGTTEVLEAPPYDGETSAAEPVFVSDAADHAAVREPGSVTDLDDAEVDGDQGEDDRAGSADVSEDEAALAAVTDTSSEDTVEVDLRREAGETWSAADDRVHQDAEMLAINPSSHAPVRVEWTDLDHDGEADSGPVRPVTIVPDLILSADADADSSFASGDASTLEADAEPVLSDAGFVDGADAPWDGVLEEDGVEDHDAATDADLAEHAFAASPQDEAPAAADSFAAAASAQLAQEDTGSEDGERLPEYTTSDIRLVAAAADPGVEEVVAPFSDMGQRDDPFDHADREADRSAARELDPVIDITSRILAKHAAMKATGRIRAIKPVALTDLASPLQVPPTSAEKLLAVVSANGWLEASAYEQLAGLCRSHASSSAGLLPRDIIARLHGSRLLGMEQVVELRATLIDQSRFPRYRFGRQLGVGTLGRTYAAVDTLTGDQVVCKIVKSGGALMQRVRSDLAAVTALRHPRLVTALGCEEAMLGGAVDGKPSGYSCAVSRLITGISLRTVLGGERPAPETWTLRVIQQVTEGLIHLHERSGQLHLGLGLGNIILQRRELESRLFLPGEQTVISDFGFAAARAERTTDLPWYAAPELHEGIAPSQQSDIWSLGALLMRMLSGEPPLAGGRSRAVLSSGLHQLTTILMSRALSSTEERYADLSEFACALAEVSSILAEKSSGSRYQTVGPRLTPQPESSTTARHRR